MLPPEYLATLPDAVVQAIDTMMESVLVVMAKRVSRYGWTDQDQWEADRLEAIGVLRTDIKRVLKEHAPEISNEIEATFTAAMQETVRQDKPYYEAADKWDEKAITQRAMQRIVQSGLKQTVNTWKNLTGTLAKETAKAFTAAMDQAWLAAATGVITPQDAGYRAIQTLCKDGIKVVTYPSGHRDTIEVASRRALLTGINQTALKAQIQLADDLGCDLVEVTAHAGARPTHALWQGKVFSLHGKTPGYTTLAAGTGYETGPGLGGWNCRHSFHPYFEEFGPAYSKNQLQDYNAKKYTYNGKALTEYEAMQQQRYYERGIRRWKREYLTAEAAGRDTTEAAVRLKAWRDKEADFLKQTGRRQDSSRSQLGGFGRSQAAKATWTAKNAVDEYGNRVIETIGRSVGAKSKNYDILHPITRDIVHLSEGTRITQPKNHVIAGKGRYRKIDEIQGLLDNYGGDELEWTKEKGFGYVDDDYGEPRRVELHWYQEPTVGKVKMKIKLQANGGIYLDED